MVGVSVKYLITNDDYYGHKNSLINRKISVIINMKAWRLNLGFF